MKIIQWQAMVTQMIGNKEMMMGNLMDMMEDDSVMCNMMNKMLMGNNNMSGMVHIKKEMPLQGGIMMCPMHGNMNKDEMKRGKLT